LHHNSFSPIKDGGKREREIRRRKKNLWMEAGKPCMEQEMDFCFKFKT
jgi:hypothetical protein